MQTRRLVTGTIAAAVLVAGTAGAAPAVAQAGPAGSGAAGNAVTAWNETAVSVLTGLPGPAGGAPPAAQVHVAMVQGAVYDAVNAIGSHTYEPYLLDRRFPATASKDAAVATAAYGVLRHLVSTVPNLPGATRAGLLDTLAGRYEDALARLRSGRSTQQGVAAGRAAAVEMLRDRRDDGRFGLSQWVPSTAAGHWVPQTGAAGQPLLDPTAWVGGVDPFVVRTASQFRSAGPLPLTSAAYAAELDEVRRLGAVDSTARSVEQTWIARWWQSTPVASWNGVARDLSLRHRMSPVDTARLLALLNLGGADSSITCWNDKYARDTWRPETAIVRAADDGNPATQPQPGWLPLIAAPYPEHPSGHLCQDGAHLSVLRRFFADVVPGGFTITSASTLLLPTDARPRTFRSFSQALTELVEARIWAGLHLRTANVQAEKIGRDVVAFMVANHLQRVAPSR
jgi:hypothetical protein